ncbi:MAG: lipoyl(octanoyl) transferase LipB [Bacteroidota bacterium]
MQHSRIIMKVFLQDLGRGEYQAVWDFQEQLMQHNLVIKAAKRNAEIAGEAYRGEETKSHFLFVEHPHVFTLGKSGDRENLLADNETLAAKQATFIATNRGGDITYHGPGQIVGYPIFDLELLKPDLVWYMRNLEEVIIKTIAHFGITSERLPGATGVWLDADDASKARKICAMGVRTSRWVTMHGFALNVNTDLNYFDMIIPCGIKDKAVTSMQQELGKEVDIAEVKAVLLKEMELVFGVEMG